MNGKYRGASHNSCNIKYLRKQYTVPIIFHNLEGYDLHLFVEMLCEEFDDIYIIPKSKEKYLCITCKSKDCQIKFKFIDSLV